MNGCIRCSTISPCCSLVYPLLRMSSQKREEWRNITSKPNGIFDYYYGSTWGRRNFHLSSHLEAEKSWLPSKAYVVVKNWSRKEHGEGSPIEPQLIFWVFFWNPKFLEISVKPQAVHWLIYLSWSEEMPVKAEVKATGCPGCSKVLLWEMRGIPRQDKVLLQYTLINRNLFRFILVRSRHSKPMNRGFLNKTNKQKTTSKPLQIQINKKWIQVMNLRSIFLDLPQ